MRHKRIVAGNRITLLKNGAEFFPALIAAIDSATVEVGIETYIFRDDVAGCMTFVHQPSGQIQCTSRLKM